MLGLWTGPSPVIVSQKNREKLKRRLNLYFFTFRQWCSRPPWQPSPSPLAWTTTAAARTRLTLCLITTQNSPTNCLRKPAQCEPALLYLRGPETTLLSLFQPQVLVLVFLVMARYPLLGCCSRLWFASSQAIKSGNFLLNMNRCQGGRLTPGGACVCAGEGCLPSGS